MAAPTTISGVTYLAPTGGDYASVLTPEASAFIARLSSRFAPRVVELLERRKARQARFDAGEKPDFLPETRHIREGDWTVAPVPADIQKRHIEITGPTDRKMVINALNSGSDVFMADFEDSNCPTWDNMVRGQLNLRDAVRRTITFAQKGKQYSLNDPAKTGRPLAVLFVRPRGWHLWEKHVIVDGQFVPGAIFDFGLYFFHNAKELLSRGTGPYFYLPKMESHLECRLWNDIFVEAQLALGVPLGTIKATCLIETLPAAFEMDEFLYELREHSAGLNCGRWDYMFSFVKTLRTDSSRIFPDRNTVGMDKHFLRSYSRLLIKQCHRRRAHAMGGMSAVIPVKGDERANKIAYDKVRADKLREVTDGHDGTWVAHPALVQVAREVFDQHLKTPNQIAAKPRLDVQVSQSDLLEVPEGPRTLATLRNNISVSLQYTAAWLSGNGCVPVHALMEDAATAEISRVQSWQWLKAGVKLEGADGPLTPDLFLVVLQQEADALRKQIGDAAYATGRWVDAAYLFKSGVLATQLPDFLTLPAYDALLASEFGKATAKA